MLRSSDNNISNIKLFCKWVLKTIINPFSIVGNLPVRFVKYLNRNRISKWLLFTINWVFMPFDIIWRRIMSVPLILLLLVFEGLIKILEMIGAILDGALELFTYVPFGIRPYKTVSDLILGKI